MRGSSTFITSLLFLVLLSCAPPLSSCASRRILHQPFFPLGSTPPTHPPSPSPSPPAPSKLPFSEATPNNSPFFPSYPSPPPPPSPSAFASFPANISSLILPQSPKPNHSSQKLLAGSLAAAFSTFAVLGIFFFFLYRRRQNARDSADDKTHRSDNSNRVYSSSNAGPTGRKFRTTSTSSEFLYLGTLVNSHNVEANPLQNDPPARKMDSPELHPLPPLHPRRNSAADPDPVGSTGDEYDDEEEFYSPRGSLGGRESTATGSGSRRVFEAVATAVECASSATCSSSISASGSPARSHSSSISPPGRLSPGPKSPEPTAVDHAAQLPPRNSTPKSPASASPESTIKTSLSGTSPSSFPSRVSNAFDPNRPSLSLSSVCSSPERAPARRSPLLSSTSTSPNRALESTPITPARTMDEDLLTSTSPERDFNKKNKISYPIAFPMIKKTSPSPSPSVTSSSSVSASSSPERGLNARISNLLNLPVSVAPPPPPPPPPLPPPSLVMPAQSDSPVASTPMGQAIISRPPALIPPSRPFVSQSSSTTVSSVEFPPPILETMESVEETPKPKLKPLHWDKVRASSDREMVWDHLRSSSFKLNEEMIETLFVVDTPAPKPKQQTTRWSVPPMANQENRVLDPKKAQNIAILLRALNVTIEEVCEALLEGNADTLGTELLESLMKMAPTKEEERKLKDYKDDSPTKLGQAEKFLKAVLDVPFAFKRVEAMLYIANFETEVEHLKRSFETLELACEELRNSRMFLKLLEAVLKTGNRMNVGTNRGDAHAFKLDTLLKLVDVKGADGKTTLLHFVVQEIIRTEGARISGTNQNANPTACEDVNCRKLGLQVVSGLSSELANVKKAAGMDSDVLSGDLAKLSRGIQDIGEVVRLNETLGSDESSQKFLESLNRFMKMAEEEIIRIQAHESVALSLVKEITEYFHGNSAKEEAHPFRIFMVVRDFLGVLDRVCKEVGLINERTIVSSAHKFPVPVNPTLPQVFPGPNVARQSNSSDEESSSS